jgi:arylsulfatase A-like enzyme
MRYLFLLCGLLGMAPLPAQDRPNVLFIMVDDLRPQLGCYGQSQMHTPNMDRLAREGILFRRAYCQQAVCNPSRTSLLTGMRPQTTQVSGNNHHFRCHIPEVVTLPQHFKNNGYFAQSIGKVYHTNFDDPVSWSTPYWMPPPVRYGKPETVARIRRQQDSLAAIGQAYRETVEHDPQGNPCRLVSEGVEVKGPSWEDPNVGDYHLRDGLTTLRTKQALRDLQAKKQPFFLALGFANPHLPFVAPKKYFDLYPPESIRLAQNMEPPTDVPDYAIKNNGDLYKYADIQGKYQVDSAKARELTRAYYAATSYVDALIGDVLNTLDSLGLTENTVILLVGDHGWHLGENGVWSKQTNFEMATRSPFIVFQPKYRHAGAQPDALVELVDVYPTLCDLAGIPVPEAVEGTSLKPLMQAPQRDWKSAAFSQYPRNLNQTKVMGHTVRTDRYRYTEWRDEKTDEIRATELYDHAVDPLENVNLAEKADFQAVRVVLQGHLRAGWRAALPKE